MEIFKKVSFVILFLICIGFLFIYIDKVKVIHKEKELNLVGSEYISTYICKFDTIIDTVVIYESLQKNVILTIYNPVENQCDNSPLITANGTKINLNKLKKDELRYCAVSRDLLKEIPYGSIIYIEGFGEYEVVDTMNKKFKNSVDILQDVSKKIFKKNNVKIIKIK